MDKAILYIPIYMIAIAMIYLFLDIMCLLCLKYYFEKKLFQKYPEVQIYFALWISGLGIGIVRIDDKEFVFCKKIPDELKNILFFYKIKISDIEQITNHKTSISLYKAIWSNRISLIHNEKS